MMSSPSSPTPEPDALREVAIRAAEGHTDAVEELVASLTPRVVGVCRRVLGSKHPDLDDAVQESLIGVVRTLPTFRGECTVLYYATCVAVRTCLALRRRSTRRERLDERRQGESWAPEEVPGDSVLLSRQRELLRDLMASLSPNLAETLTLRIVVGLSLAEVADAMGIPVNTVRSRVRLAKEGLRRMIEADPVAADLLKEDP